MKQTHFYLRDRKGHPIGVVAMRKEDDGVRVAASLCSTEDAWDKHVGVAKAVGRLESDAASRTIRQRVPIGVLLRGMFCNGWTCARLIDIDIPRAAKAWDSQYERLTTPPPWREPATVDLESFGQGIAS